MTAYDAKPKMNQQLAKMRALPAAGSSGTGEAKKGSGSAPTERVCFLAENHRLQPGIR